MDWDSEKTFVGLTGLTPLWRLGSEDLDRLADHWWDTRAIPLDVLIGGDIDRNVPTPLQAAGERGATPALVNYRDTSLCPSEPNQTSGKYCMEPASNASGSVPPLRRWPTLKGNIRWKARDVRVAMFPARARDVAPLLSIPVVRASSEPTEISEVLEAGSGRNRLDRYSRQTTSVDPRFVPLVVDASPYWKFTGSEVLAYDRARVIDGALRLLRAVRDDGPTTIVAVFGSPPPELIRDPHRVPQGPALASLEELSLNPSERRLATILSEPSALEVNGRLQICVPIRVLPSAEVLRLRCNSRSMREALPAIARQDGTVTGLEVEVSKGPHSQSRYTVKLR